MQQRTGCHDAGSMQESGTLSGDARNGHRSRASSDGKKWTPAVSRGLPRMWQDECLLCDRAQRLVWEYGGCLGHVGAEVPLGRSRERVQLGGGQCRDALRAKG